MGFPLHHLALVLLVCVTLTSSKSHHPGGVLMRSTSRLGEEEMRVRYGHVLALESVIPGQGEQGLYYRQVTNGRYYIQAIYKGRENMVDCDLMKDDHTGAQSKFEKEFHGKEREVKESHMKNVTVVHLDESSKRDDMIRHILDVPTMKTECRKLHRQQKHQLKENARVKERHENAIDAFTHLRGKKVDLSSKDISKKLGKSQRFSRQKRSLIYPGTNWCGNGNAALEYSDLGENVATDKCCRGHDHCPYTIEGFANKYNYFNFRFHTLSHCHCDEIFRSCLRSAANNVAEMVGQLYFNVVGTKCFTLKPIKTCANRSWWGSCTEWTKDHEAVINDPFQF